MRIFFITTGLITSIGLCLLLIIFNYGLDVIFYNFIIIFFIHLIIFTLNILCCYIPNIKLRSGFIHVINFIFFTLLLLFYITILVSNAFWGKAISLNLFLNYISSFNTLINILPVEAWIVYFVIILLFVFILVMFSLTHPKVYKINLHFQKIYNNKNHLKKIYYVIIGSLVILLLFNEKLIEIKRFVHFSGEPILEFISGQMWDSESLEYVYDTNRIKNALYDQKCINEIKKEEIKHENRIIIIILLDALRRDFLPVYGYERNTTPFLDSLFQAKAILKVENTFSTSTTTLLGVAGLFNSKDWNNFSYAGLNLMKYLKFKNFSTYAFLTGQHRSWYGLSSIYRNDCDYFYESTTSPMKQNYDDLTTLQKFQSTNFNTNSFIYFHLLSTHNIGKKNKQFRKFIPDKIGINTDKKTALINNYDNGIMQADYVISEIFSKLKNDGLLEKSTIYILSDHGELFGEENRWSHSGSIQQDVLSIPLIIYDQNLSWYKNLEVATIKDLAPTIADRLNYNVPTCWEGISLGKPIQNFIMNVNSGSASEYPLGILSNNDSLIKLQIMDEFKSIKKTVIKKTNKDGWEVQSN